jgi:hypothetical protein
MGLGLPSQRVQGCDSVARGNPHFYQSLQISSNSTGLWHYRRVMSNTSWRGRLVANLSSWLVQEGPLEQVGCECCTEINCTSDNYAICQRRLDALEMAKSRGSDVPPESTVRLTLHAVDRVRRSVNED